ncbi:CinA family protein [Georgenia satyanarayanai]|uniref:CinA family protein n=1 Tax=Georgenia satyanarayanai TaxID=860221 RepID=UPI00203E7A70|nr:CinA family protein [Georgenia satyanarayanai]MCM3659851.1 CinA family protein [Georgenia satyanarayanai]
MANTPHLTDDAQQLARTVAEHAIDRGVTVATAESLTSGQIAVHLGAAPNAGTWFSGGAVTYTVEAKQKALGVPDVPVISEACARTMAEGAARLLGADCAVAVTGVGGPDRQEDQPVGTVFIAIHTPAGTTCEKHHFDGDPQEILDATTARALKLLGAGLEDAGGK